MREFLRLVLASLVGTGLVVVLFFLVVVGSMVGAVGFSSQSSWSEGQEKTGQKDILKVRLAGPLVERYQPPSLLEGISKYNEPRGLGLFELTQTLKAAAQDSEIKGLFLDIQGLAAGWGHLQSLRREITKFKEAGKFVVAYSEAYSEKTYYLASVADKVYIYPRGFLEWDGMVSSSTYFKRAMDKWGVKPRIFRVGRYKSAVEPFITDQMSEASREQMNALIGGIWGEVVETVANERQVKSEDLEKWAGEVSTLFAFDAKEKGLVDELAPMEEVELHLVEKTKAEKNPGWFHWNLYHQEKVLSKGSRHNSKIAVIIADGSIVDGVGEPGQVGSHQYRKIMAKIRDDEKVRGVVLRVNSPGGSALASDVMWMSSQYLKEKKPVVASFGNVAASGGYYMSAGAQEILAEELSITGSIGVFGLNFNTKQFWNEHIGLTFDTEKTHQMADRQSSVRDLTTRESEQIQSVVDHIYDDFLTVVTQGREALTTKEESHKVAQGRVWLGTDAKEMGLVDQFGGLEEALGRVAELAELKEGYDVVVYPRERSPVEEVLRHLGQASGQILSQWLPPSFLNALEAIKPSQSLQEMILARMPFDIELN